VVDIHRYPDMSRRTPRDGPLEVVWIGQRSTGRYLQPLVATMRQLEQAGLCRFTAIGIDAAQFGLPMLSLPWDEQREAAMLSEFDVGLMPLPDTPFERGKCGYKLVQYMACGIPVIASPVGVNVNLVTEGVNGFLANTAADWESAMRKLAGDSALRMSMGEAGRKRVACSYSLDLMSSRLIGLLDGAAKGRRNGANIHG
jgi:glycosyltransferase involved in cell wall biosynthesis